MKYLLSRICLLTNFACCTIFIFLTAGCADSTKVQPIEAICCNGTDIVVDGKASEKFWQNAKWVQLDGITPSQNTNELDGRLLQQRNQSVKAAVMWSSAGIYIAMVAEDFDVQGNKRRHNDWIWLEDALEVFVASSVQNPAMPTGHHIELQVNPVATTFTQVVDSGGEKVITKPEGIKVVSYVDGSVNDSKNMDRYFSCEWFLSWAALKELGILCNDFTPARGEKPLKMRFASWDLNIYSQTRINRFTTPGSDNPHQPEFYRLVILE